jgi:hypothetical protein
MKGGNSVSRLNVHSRDEAQRSEGLHASGGVLCTGHDCLQDGPPAGLSEGGQKLSGGGCQSTPIEKVG